jgi:hypothetical protein
MWLVVVVSVSAEFTADQTKEEEASISVLEIKLNKLDVK